ncbi:MAG: NAD/FAD-utilizing enzyme [Gammaproteobacteria bacterium]|nr:NAD/FAD-utilizing enzyme [Gammaproteobacteria bacterium]
MKRHYFISNNLDDLDSIEQQLESKGIHRSQIHVLSRDDAGVETHEHLHNIESVLKYDVVHSTMLGAIVGFILAIATLAIAEFSNLTATYTWTPFLFLAVVLFGFSTWFGGYHGIQTPHKDFKKFEGDLNAGRHVFFVDIDKDQKNILNDVTSSHPGLIKAGTGTATPRWVVMGQDKAVDIATHTFP